LRLATALCFASLCGCGLPANFNLWYDRQQFDSAYKQCLSQSEVEHSETDYSNVTSPRLPMNRLGMSGAGMMPAEVPNAPVLDPQCAGRVVRLQIKLLQDEQAAGEQSY
jgi:hypothetical protein